MLAALLGLLLVFPAYAQTEQSESVKAWKARLSAHIASYRQFPPEALGQTGEARVTFVIDRSGRLISHALAVSTGARLLDDAALRIVDHAQPFPAPPSELKDDTFTLTVPIVFSDRRFRIPLSGLVLYKQNPVLTEDDPIATWRKAVVEHVRRNIKFPPAAIGQRGDAGVIFVVDRMGKLISNAFLETSGIPALDAEALAMVERSVPFPKPPADAKDDLQRVIILMTFDGTQPPPAGPLPEGEKFLKSWIEDQAKLNAKSPAPSDAKLNSMLRSICRGC
ncbi:TonB family protein [Bradyrhizobium stylosanthis]|uniref:TonB family protein n=1 Tax=Bradyrhizobium stylosanthis TaxID=1803665 RepID=UPI001FD9788D|nr:TonB family protein [Bradyrhizobium stylosanthis]